jgi:hypothetical protein
LRYKREQAPERSARLSSNQRPVPTTSNKKQLLIPSSTPIHFRSAHRKSRLPHNAIITHLLHRSPRPHPRRSSLPTTHNPTRVLRLRLSKRLRLRQSRQCQPGRYFRRLLQRTKGHHHRQLRRTYSVVWRERRLASRT